MNIQRFCTPGIVLAQIFPKARSEKGMTISALEKAQKLDFYGAMEIADVLDVGERKEIRSFVKENKIKLNYWISLIQYTAGVSISAIDENERKKAVAQLILQIPFAIECGATYVGFFSGPDVEPHLRPVAKNQLLKSIQEFSRAVDQFGSIDFLLESMDRSAHKKHVIGPTLEAVEFILQARKSVPNLDLNFDTAHIKLLEENTLDSLVIAKSVMSQIHLANCVDDISSPLFGDNHMPFGEPGYLTEDYLVRFFTKGLEIGFFGNNRPVVSSEVFCADNGKPWEAEKKCRELMIRATERLDDVSVKVS